MRERSIKLCSGSIISARAVGMMGSAVRWVWAGAVGRVEAAGVEDVGVADFGQKEKEGEEGALCPVDRGEGGVGEKSAQLLLYYTTAQNGRKE